MRPYKRDFSRLSIGQGNIPVIFPATQSGIFPNVSNLAERVRERLSAVNLKPTPASEAAGLGKDFIRDILRGKKLSIGLDAANSLAKILKTTPDWLIESEGHGDNVSPYMESADDIEAEAPSGIRFGGVVEAGTFRRINTYNQDADYETIPILPYPSYPHDKQFAYRVEGDSMNLEKIFPGMWLHAVDRFTWEHYHGAPRDGELVIVEAVRNGGEERELTVKMLRTFRDRVELHPRSTNPDHQIYIIPYVQPDDYDDKIHVIAVVLSSTWLHRYKGP